MRNLIKRFFSAVADSVGGGVSRATSADTGKKKYVGIGSLTYLCSKIKSALSLKFDKSNIVQNATTTATDKVPSAAVAKNLQDQITALNTKNVGAIFFDNWYRYHEPKPIEYSVYWPTTFHWFRSGNLYVIDFYCRITENTMQNDAEYGNKIFAFGGNAPWMQSNILNGAAIQSLQGPVQIYFPTSDETSYQISAYHNGYGAFLYLDNNCVKIARYHNTDGETSQWPLSAFVDGSLMIGRMYITV